jgi:hypothetical protein
MLWDYWKFGEWSVLMTILGLPNLVPETAQGGSGVAKRAASRIVAKSSPGRSVAKRQPTTKDIGLLLQLFEDGQLDLAPEHRHDCRRSASSLTRTSPCSWSSVSRASISSRRVIASSKKGGLTLRRR